MAEEITETTDAAVTDVPPKKKKGASKSDVHQVDALLLYMSLLEAIESVREVPPESAALAILRQFSGLVLRMPTTEAVEEMLLGISLARSLHCDPSQQNVIRLGDLFALDRKKIQGHFRRAVGISLQDRRNEIASGAQ